MPKSISIPVTEASQVGEARRAAHRLGMEMGLDATALGSLGIIVTEAATNLHKHAMQGEIILRQLRSGARAGIEVLSLDRGPGIAEVARCLEDGYSTAGTQGNGLGSIRRLSSLFDIYSTPQGTALVSQLWQGPPPDDQQIEIGAVCLPYPGETACGDAWSASSGPSSCSILMADGLGHGPEAAQAADQAVEVFAEQPKLPPQLVLQKIHAALRSTRGAAVLVLQIEDRSRKIVCSGIGNISGGQVSGENTKSFVSLNGTVGHQAQRFQEFSYDWLPAALLVMHSDGLQTKWKLSLYPGLQRRHPSLIAAILYRDYRRGRDDVTVLVARQAVLVATP